MGDGGELARAERRIFEAEDRVLRQLAAIARLAVAGRDTGEAERRLREMHRALGSMHEHRRSILADRAGVARGHCQPDRDRNGVRQVSADRRPVSAIFVRREGACLHGDCGHRLGHAST